MVKKILAVLTGIVVAFAVIYAAELAGHRLFPLPQPADPANRPAMEAMMKTVPAGALAALLVAHALGSLAGGFCATAISRDFGFRATIIVALLLLAAGILNLVLIPHPRWFGIADVLVYIPFALLGYRIAPRRPVQAGA